MIVKTLLRNLVTPTWTRAELLSGYSLATAAGQTVTPESSKAISAAYRCANIISDDVAKIPLQQFISRVRGQIERVRPDPVRRNLAYVIEVQPNRFQTPFILKRTAIQWLLFYGNAYLWMPQRRSTEIFCIPSTAVTPRLDGSEIVYDVLFDTGLETIPAVEMLHLLINSVDGLTGRGVIRYARETLGRRQGASETQNVLYAQGLTPAAVAFFAGELSREARERVRESYSEAMQGSAHTGRLAVMDSKVTKFEVVQMHPVDAQFLESIQATDVEIANFFGVPLYKLNQGKQSYESNDQQNLDYLNTTLDPYLVQWEQAAQIRWLSAMEQADTYWRFERNVILRTDPAARAAYQEKKILSGQMSPNEARAIDDMPSYLGGDMHVMPSNMAIITPEGELQTGQPAGGSV